MHIHMHLYSICIYVFVRSLFIPLAPPLSLFASPASHINACRHKQMISLNLLLEHMYLQRVSQRFAKCCFLVWECLTSWHFVSLLVSPLAGCVCLRASRFATEGRNEVTELMLPCFSHLFSVLIEEMVGTLAKLWLRCLKKCLGKWLEDVDRDGKLLPDEFQILAPRLRIHRVIGRMAGRFAARLPEQ